MENFATAHLLGRLTRNVSSRRRLLKKGLWLLALFFCFLALARPQYGLKWVEVKRKGIDILFALDTSKSMLTEDIRPNRLERAKLAIMDFVNQLEGDRVGLLPFSGSAFLMCPLTIDYNAFEASLTTVNTATIPRGGTDLERAIGLAESSLVNNANHKILVLLTDGENLEGDALAAAIKAAQNGMTIFTVGVGTTQGELIPLSSGGQGNFVKDESGKFITSKLDERALTAIAEAAGGLYVPLGKNGEGLQRIYQQKLSLIPKKELAEKQHKEPMERFNWPLGAAIVLLMVEFMISGRKSERSFRLPFIKTAGRRIRKKMNWKSVALLLLIPLAGLDQAHASPGEKAFADGDFITASEFYSQALKKNPDDPRLHYNAGTAAYKNNLYDDAISSFQEALKSEDLGLQEQTYYNLGNTWFKKGEELAQSDPGQAEELWQKSLDAYEGSLKLNPQDKDSSANRDLVSRRLEELKKQQEQQKKEQQDKQDQQQQDQDQKQEQRQDQKQNSDQQSRKGEQGQPEKQDGQGQQQKNDSAAGQKESPKPAKDSEDQAGDSKEQDISEAGQEQKPEQPEAGSEDEQQKDTAASQAAQQGQDEKRSQAGRMTSEEARQLLSRLKDEEGKLNFVPRFENGEAEKEGTWKDW
ncbi:MAG: VWA domain-containing protein [Proteobacteria bacterium]|jgi:Ca-activated chloride channel family protein|nr:VWA domain-containing protein [Desulfocapsa sp.]MBU3946315.1 VWA domain-containing protein [Pseudomonadota bacterium]MCG2743005.1 VWA domain-containing protein [Desulfobacteraceae bacterium]MBU3983898.1 VWA domain-containing protein [Pseudomonadota bacterium]MBU4028202.1 VWA domain-containing protein [Pseudomonadota bacterium]